MNDIVYKCKYCNKCFNINDTKNKHELICNTKDIYYKLKYELKEVKNKEKELEYKEHIINKYKEENLEQKYTITDLRNQLYILHQVSLVPKNNTNIININNLNVNFNEIQNHLPHYDINVLSNKMSIIKFILDIFIDKLIVVDKKKKMIYWIQKVYRK